jgi:hypothetical protein
MLHPTESIIHGDEPSFRAASASSSPSAASSQTPAAKRRAEDYAQERRRATDAPTVNCRYCNGEILATAVRCKHCSEIVNDTFYRERARRIRARVNYASWIAYLFGLAALLVFRPVGLVSIASGLVLSIAYYAIPAEPGYVARDGKRRRNFTEFVKRQVKLERVSVPIPKLHNKKLIFVGTPLIAAIIGYSMNFFLLQQPVNDVLKENAAFNGMSVSAHYQYWVVPGVVVYDLRSLTMRQTPLDVHTAFLEFAKKMRVKKFARVDLSYKGTTKFSMDGASFQQVGNQYAKKNFEYVLNKFPRLFTSLRSRHVPNGDAARDREELLRFHRQWYGDDEMTQTVHGATPVALDAKKSAG